MSINLNEINKNQYKGYKDFEKKVKIQNLENKREQQETDSIIKNREIEREKYLNQRNSGKRKNEIFSIQLQKYILYEDFLKMGKEFIEKEEELGMEEAERRMGN